MASRPIASEWPLMGSKAPSRVSFSELYLRLLTWAFTLFSSVRIASYVPTLYAIYISGDSSQALALDLAHVGRRQCHDGGMAV